MNTKKGLSVLAGVILIFAAAACDFSPSSPFEGFDEEQQEGATLRGQVQQSGVSTASQQSVALGFRAQRSLSSTDGDPVATEVEVYDSCEADAVLIGSVDIDPEDGSFTLRGLPSEFSLVFLDQHEDPINDEPMCFLGVKPNQEIDVVVAVEDGAVVVVEESRTGIDHEGSSGIEIEGTAKVVDVESDKMTGTVEVDGYTVHTRAGETSIRKGQQSLTLDLIDGEQVHVRGVFEDEDNNIVFAFEIKLQEEEEENEGKVTLCHVPPGNPANEKTITVGAGAVAAHLAHGDRLGACE